jgi:predicted phage tail protein
MKKVRLFGDLQKFRDDWDLDVQTPGEALRAIEANRPGFLAACDAGDYIAILIDADDPDKSRQVILDNSIQPWNEELLVVVPRAGGEIPLAFFAAAFASIGASATVATIASAIVATVINVGISLAISAIANVITSDKKKVSASQTEKPGSRPSYISNGPVNVINQGHPYPIIAGEFLCGSVVASSQIHIKDIPT